jgi:hypothetical protein
MAKARAAEPFITRDRRASGNQQLLIDREVFARLNVDPSEHVEVADRERHVASVDWWTPPLFPIVPASVPDASLRQPTPANGGAWACEGPSAYCGQHLMSLGAAG